MQAEDLRTGLDPLAIAEQTVAVNLLGTLRTTAALMPPLLAQPSATVMTVSSGLAFLPIFPNPSWCAIKAAIHSWTQSLRYQLRDTKIDVIEIVPPYVQTELTDPFQAADPNAMPLAEYIHETMELLENPPTLGEILVDRVKSRRFAVQTTPTKSSTSTPPRPSTPQNKPCLSARSHPDRASTSSTNPYREPQSLPSDPPPESTSSHHIDR